MCDPVTASLAAASALKGVMQIGQTSSAAAAGYQAVERNIARSEAANARQAVDINEQTVEAETDRYRQANRELGALRVAMGEMGVGSSSRTALVRRQGGVAGLDLRRIRRTNQRQLGALRDANVANRQAGQEQVSQLYSSARFSNLGSALGALTGPLQIVGQQQALSSALKAAGNPKPSG